LREKAGKPGYRQMAVWVLSTITPVSNLLSRKSGSLLKKATLPVSEPMSYPQWKPRSQIESAYAGDTGARMVPASAAAAMTPPSKRDFLTMSRPLHDEWL
jgi:hypothetical protein